MSIEKKKKRDGEVRDITLAVSLSPPPPPHTHTHNRTPLPKERLETQGFRQDASNPTTVEGDTKFYWREISKPTGGRYQILLAGNIKFC